MDETVKKKVEALTRELPTLPEEALEHLLNHFRRNSYSARLDGHHSVRSILEEGGGTCHKTDLLVLSGRDRTDRSGKAVLPIHRLLCGVATEGMPSDTQLVLIREPEFTATPLSKAPVFATFVSRSSRAAPGSYIVFDRNNGVINQPVLATVEIEVMMWKHDGTAAAETYFSWVCTVEAARRRHFG